VKSEVYKKLLQANEGSGALISKRKINQLLSIKDETAIDIKDVKNRSRTLKLGS